MAVSMKVYTAPTSSSSSSYDAAGNHREVREYRPAYAPTKPKWLSEADPERLQRLEQRMINRRGSRSYPGATPSKRKWGEAEPSTSNRFQLTGVRHVMVEPFLEDVMDTFLSLTKMGYGKI